MQDGFNFNFLVLVGVICVEEKWLFDVNLVGRVWVIFVGLAAFFI